MKITFCGAAGTEDGVVLTGWSINVVDGTSVGVNEFEELTGFSLYPSPASDQITIRYEGEVSSGLQLTIRDLQGRMINMTSEAQRSGVNIYEINISDLSTGSYFIEALSEGHRTVRQFEVMR